jgi:hypothetical protein
MRPLLSFTVLIIGILNHTFANAQHTEFLVDTNITFVDAGNPPFNQVLPGDAVLLQAGTRPFLGIRDFSGIADNPISFINYALPAYPDPALIQLVIPYDFSGNSDVFLDINNLQGARIFSALKSMDSSGSSSFRMDILTLPARIYMYSLRSGNDVITGKFIKME